ncbi:serine/threonine-protein kinase [Neorhodopirellula pilleata]|uniref:non-specific serine/threonine protein kinase n=1 Tax=Neorhodopirellula pilleata TaxID=2714738 RepID=A0A5C5ZYS5_9BACT|nr:serine/threonine-protein kinase [Neorhodopirellula pilleata]TWT92260.1 Serine/threonine-protein kinase PknA [Neorhodopirellula pilleata]
MTDSDDFADHDFRGDEWLRPSSARETRLKISDDQLTRGVSKRPRLEKPPWGSGEVVAGFELIEVIGFGSHGWVFSAIEVATGKEFAVKILPAVNQKEAVRAKTGFRRMSKLRHQGLVRLHRIHHSDEWLAFSMERIHGENLVEVLRLWKSLPLAEACDRLIEMIRQVGSALAWTHAHQLVHRDIKPTNLMMTDDGDRFVIIDCDLTGKFEAESDPENIRAYLIWTPMYVAPEVMFRQSYCPASDIFSLGMVVLEALRLFSASHRESIARDQIVASRTAKKSDDVIASNAVDDDAIARDEESYETDREHINNAILGIDDSIPDLLRDIVDEMLSPDVSDRPTAMSLSRLGQPLATARPNASFTNNESIRAVRITQTARQTELAEFRRWTHLILGGQVQRLHIEGASGIGKSTFLDMAVEELRRQSWAQVLTARCQRFEQRPFQAFSQIVDEIIMRYRQGKIGKLSVDSVSESILQRSLPGFEEVLEVDWSESPIVTSPSRPGGLDAGMKACNELRRAGPVFFVIDDVQWADQDTLHVLDHFQSTVDHRIGPPQYQGLGIITVSRCDGDRQQHKPHHSINLGPLSKSVTRQAIQQEVAHQGVELTEEQIQSLNEQIDGLPYRLDVYLGELTPSGLLQSGPTAAGRSAPTIHEVWQYRSDRLSVPIRRLLDLIVVAGRQVTFDELRWIADTSNTALLETQLDELVEQRLLVRDGADGQLLSVWHDQLGQQLIREIPEDQRIAIHRHWAESLASQITIPCDEDSGSFHTGQFKAASRIAEHFEKAGIIESFVYWAKVAAEQSQHLYAPIESARWYRSVADHTWGAEKTDALQMSAEALERGGRVYEAAQVYLELSELLTGQAKLEAELDQVHCFIRSGRFNEVTDRLAPLLARLKLPSKKSPWRTQLSLVWRMSKLRLRERFGPTPAYDPAMRTMLQSNQIAACLRLIRPLSYIDNWLSAELSLYCGDLVRNVGTKHEKIEILVGECVFNSYQPGKARRQAMELLNELDASLDQGDEPSRRGDVKAGYAWAVGMDGRFAEVSDFAQQSREAYLSSEIYHGFEIAHTSYIESVAYFQTGQLDALGTLVDNMQNESASTSDQFVLAMGSLGYASVGFLRRDDVASLQQIDDSLSVNLAALGVDGFALVGDTKNLLTAIYQNRSGELLSALQRAEKNCIRSVTYRRVQVLRILVDELRALVLLSHLPHADAIEVRKFNHVIGCLRRQKLPVATCKADLIEGIALCRYPEKFNRLAARSFDRAERLLLQAKKSAGEQGLLPSKLVAEDQLSRLAGKTNPSRLNDFLEQQGVKDTIAFARLYGG